jgi:hypothetical protein
MELLSLGDDLADAGKENYFQVEAPECCGITILKAGVQRFALIFFQTIQAFESIMNQEL